MTSPCSQCGERICEPCQEALAVELDDMALDFSRYGALRLAAAVIEQAVKDYRGEGFMGATDEERREARRTAEWFLFAPDSHLPFFAWPLGIDPEVIREGVRKRPGGRSA